jgi:uncharacterized protein YmfQ (DUF2313 family)
MSKLWEPKDSETLKYWLDSIETEASDKLTDWENSFIESIWSRIKAGYTLSQKQEEILERIYAEKTS